MALELTFTNKPWVFGAICEKLLCTKNLFVVLFLANFCANIHNRGTFWRKIQKNIIFGPELSILLSTAQFYFVHKKFLQIH